VPARWIGILALAALIVGVGFGVWLKRNPPPRPVKVIRYEDLIGDSLAQALRQARNGKPAAADTSDKSRWVDEVKGFDVADLTPTRRATFVRFANAERCTCGCGYTLAGCRSYDPTCPVSEPRVQKLLDSVRAGRYSSGP